VAVTEGIDDIGCPMRPADYRKRVRQARPMSHPYAEAIFGIVAAQGREHALCVAEEDPSAPPIGRCGEPCKLDRACEPQAQLHRRRNEFAVRVSDWNAGRHFRIADHDVVATLSLERNAISELRGQGL